MGYTIDECMVRVDFFKENGKWYTTEAVRWIGEYNFGLPEYEFAFSLENHLFKDGKYRLSDMTAVCLQPYHHNSFPLMMKVSDINMYLEKRIKYYEEEE
jgi:hypothetical protein